MFLTVTLSTDTWVSDVEDVQNIRAQIAQHVNLEGHMDNPPGHPGRSKTGVCVCKTNLLAL